MENGASGVLGVPVIKDWKQDTDSAIVLNQKKEEKNVLVKGKRQGHVQVNFEKAS